MAKTSQLQLRLTPTDKAEIQRRARDAGLDVSAWVLSRLLPPASQRFERLLNQLKDGPPSYGLAELSDQFERWSPTEFSAATEQPPTVELSDHLQNYVAAMIELSAQRKGVAPPDWVSDVPPLQQPYFATRLVSLRMHLLRASPPPFRRRNIFIDSSVGDRA